VDCVEVGVSEEEEEEDDMIRWTWDRKLLGLVRRRNKMHCWFGYVWLQDAICYTAQRGAEARSTVYNSIKITIKKQSHAS
jgi:hypothetical protein